MYFFDPAQGVRRRAALRSLLEEAQEPGRTSSTPWAAKRQGHRLEGVMAGTLLPSPAPAEDRVLADRVRNEIRRLLANPHTVEVNVSRGHVVLTGHLLKVEVEDLIRGVSWVPGVERVEVGLGVHDEPAILSQEQRPGSSPGRWPLLAGVSGCLLLWGVARRDPTSLLLGGTGLLWTVLHEPPAAR